VPAHRLLEARLLLARADARVDKGGGDATRLERVHLVLHERDERRDDEGHAAEQASGELVGERLARPSRHHADAVATGHDRFDDGQLPRPEPIESEQRLELAPERFVRYVLEIGGNGFEHADQLGRERGRVATVETAQGLELGRQTLPFVAGRHPHALAQALDAGREVLVRHNRRIADSGVGGKPC